MFSFQRDVSGDLAHVESQILNVKRKIDNQNRKNSALQKEFERLHYVNLIFDDKSDDDEIKPRKLSSVSSSANAKRKLTNSKTISTFSIWIVVAVILSLHSSIPRQHLLETQNFLPKFSPARIIIQLKRRSQP